MAETLQTLSIISFVVAGVFLVISVFLWLLFKIPTIIGDLSGRTAKKSIAKMRAANEKTGVKSYKESQLNAERGKLTSTMPPAQPAPPVATPPVQYSPITNAVEVDRPETGLLVDNKITNFASQETGVLEAEGTSLLVDENVTAPLEEAYEPLPQRPAGKKLEMLDAVCYIHTDEVIG